MRSWFVLILFGSLLVQTLSRPQQTEYSNDSGDVDEAEEEEESEPAAEELLTEEDESRLTENEPSVQEEGEVPRSRHLLDLTESRYLQRNTADDSLAQTKTDNDLIDSKLDRNRETRENSLDTSHFNEPLGQFPRNPQSNTYIESADDQQEATQHLTNRDINKSNRIIQDPAENQINKRTVEFESPSNEEGEMLFEKSSDQIGKADKNEYSNNEVSQPDDQPHYYKQYYDALQAENRDNMIEDKSRDSAHYTSRDRRDIKDADQVDTTNASNNPGSKESNDKTDSEDEETAIKRHIKKLSGEELDQLMNSLTDEKRELLKKIIDDVDANDNAFINKREITKKAGAVEENNYIENCQSDLSKVQGGSPISDINTESSPVSNSETTEISNKQPEGPTESADLATPKSAETSISSINKIELHNDEAIQLKKSDSNLNTFTINLDPKNQGELVANVQVTTKTENKREVNLEDLEALDEPKTMENDLNLQNAQDYAGDQGYFCSQEDSLSKLDDDQQIQQEGKTYKRETYPEKQPDVSDSIKSLEESFPNSNSYDDTAPYSGPLVRVKRKNSEQIIKKRAAGLLPDAKVAYFPYKAENEDEDNDEGNEFDDEGFYDRTSNFANGNKDLDDEVANADNAVPAKNTNVDNAKLPHENLESDTMMSLGSDTDSVLSGVEGVDDNLMFSSGTRDRRTADDGSNGSEEVKSEPSTSILESELKPVSKNYFNVPQYQENDAFGALPRNYDGDLARYKRIRRVKQSHNTQELSSSDG
ncbi:unnamed protein product [Spodoptera exigua]|uniref:Uncharacterized protein n=1 Tax=Spodoptera exigua TaxID=7107 RepID=A0A835GT68_SPOEX|nr:hypothetical protein HW555_000150 [Spodoptera exigua]KAH9642528.1 hypothetical protein HF086_008938 [Spodoptera exigua]CAH0695890.1 unnamed protein product [Spodoptera exigua]